MPDGTLDPVGFAQISRTGLSPTTVWLPNHFCYLCACVIQSTTPQVLLPVVWPLSISLAATLEIDVSFSSSAYLDVSVQRVPFVWLWIHHTMTVYCTAGFPHSEICGSKAICASPQLIAACHVLHRLLMPRHSPCALVHLTVLLESYEFFLFTLLYGKTSISHCSVFKVQNGRLASLVMQMHHLVGLGGLEPPTSRLSGVRSNLLSYRPVQKPSSRYGGDEEDRTPDLLRAKQALSQLSYTPVWFRKPCRAFKIK